MPIRRLTPSDDTIYSSAGDARTFGLALFPRPALRRGLSRIWNSPMTYFAYLDEFGHIGPYLGRKHPRYNDSPVFGFAGLVLPVNEVRGFGTWFFQRKCHLLDFELERSGEHPAQWEKKGSSLYTVADIERYRQPRTSTWPAQGSLGWTHCLQSKCDGPSGRLRKRRSRSPIELNDSRISAPPQLSLDRS